MSKPLVALAKTQKSFSDLTQAVTGIPTTMRGVDHSSPLRPMTRFPLPVRLHRTNAISKGQGGFSLNEAVIALAAGTLVIGAGAIALRSTQSLITTSGEKTTQRQNAVNGLRLMRSEIERSLHTLVSGTPPNEELGYTDLGEYSSSVKQCQGLVNKAFVPLFGLKMADVTGQPVIYGLGSGSSTTSFALQRCGTPLGLDGRYDNSKDPFIATVVDGIRMMPCLQKNEKGDCISTAPKIPGKPNIKPSEITSTDILDFMNNDPETNFYQYEVVDNTTPSRNYLEPALRIKTDESRKLISFVAPMDCDTKDADAICISSSQFSVAGSSDTGSQQALRLTAFARADKRLMNPDEETTSLGGDWFRNVTSRNVRFLLDGSGSMSACMTWSFDDDGDLEMGNTTRTYFTPQGDPLYRGRSYESSRAICHETRMERLQSQLIELLQQLPDDTNIGLEVFSTPDRANNRSWAPSRGGLVKLTSENRASALAFVDSLDDATPTSWGGTKPWNGLQRAFNDKTADTLYFLSDGLPTSRLLIPNKPDATYSNQYLPAGEYYAAMNQQRTESPLVVNSTSVKLSSKWMEDLSIRTSGTYLQSS